MMDLGLSQQNLQETQHTLCGPRDSAVWGGWKHQEQGSQAGTGFTGPLALGIPQNVPAAAFQPRVLLFNSSPEELIKAMTVSFKRPSTTHLRNSSW